MSDKTRIEWTDATWNPVTGCAKVSQGCKHCYAERDWCRLVHMPAFAGRAFTDVACHPERLDQPLRWKKPRRVFVNSMSDLFHIDVPFEFVDRVFAVMALSPQHTFQVLTKRPERMREYLTTPDRAKIIDSAIWFWGTTGELRKYMAPQGENWRMTFPLPNVCLGVSIEDQATANERIPLLLQTPAAVRWVSAEPLLGPVVLGAAHLPVFGLGSRIAIDWLVVGGESGPKARPMHPRWVRSLRDQCAAHWVPFLFKQWGEWAPSSTLPKDTRLAYERWGWISENGGEPDRMHDKPFKDEYAHHELMGKVGKTAAGRLLDGVLHDDFYEGEPF